MSADNVLVVVKLEDGRYLCFDESFSQYSTTDSSGLSCFDAWVRDKETSGWCGWGPVCYGATEKEMREAIYRYEADVFVEYGVEWNDQHPIAINPRRVDAWIHDLQR